MSTAMPHPDSLISLGNGARLTSPPSARYYRLTPDRFISADETMSVSAYETTDNGGTVAATAAETAVLAGDCRRQLSNCRGVYIDC